MDNFDPNKEHEIIDNMILGISVAEKNSGGQLAAVRMMDDVSNEWCKLSASQKKQTADIDENILKNGNEQYIGIQSEWAAFTPFRCPIAKDDVSVKK